MIKYILIAGCVCFSMLGLAEFLHGIKTKLIASGKKGTTYAVVFLSEKVYRYPNPVAVAVKLSKLSQKQLT